MYDCYFLVTYYNTITQHYSLLEIAYQLGFSVKEKEDCYVVYKDDKELLPEYGLDWNPIDILSDYVESKISLDRFGYKIFKARRVY